ncbi:F0F1 ATP synthase subunit delta [Guptibacillus hwajinpoensis]|uniref:F0F1 ATP synthase subunit delta n=1 Tax=Guptibacillus hwajinpoensis TaxID=208199 RepID=UPI0018841ED1|nr:F0F1 ATP synthase subunit delta [Pseudalkalibacillus hwajinpoensis]MBF0705249.1 F0F1 ATP synthase subunit delta [Pseudalkalibacillus hwajinpoensis]WLR61658.1 F0F1 ATP synthase subunit delta [Pseudalkalibacillus hwajinpoensis]
MSRDLEVIAKRYAGALFDIARENDNVEQVKNELVVVKDVFHQTPNLMNVFEHPKFTEAQKKELIQTSFGSSLSAPVMNTLLTLIERKRVAIVFDLVSQFERFTYEQQQKAAAKVYSVKPLTEEEQMKVSAVFAKRVGKTTLLIENVIDPTLIGGIKVRIGNRIFDGSISGKLKRMERELVSAKS